MGLENRLVPNDIGDMQYENLLKGREIKEELEKREYLKIFSIMSRLVGEEDFLMPYGIHGLTHTKRVLMLILCLGIKLDISREDLLLLSLCALYHDVGRVDDGVDPHHGQASFAKASSILAKTGYDMEMMRYIIENHNVSDKTGNAAVVKYNLRDQHKAQRLLAIFKDADGLDRLRFNDLNARWLRHDEARELIPIARQLLVELL